jgi:hypothetical protein
MDIPGTPSANPAAAQRGFVVDLGFRECWGRVKMHTGILSASDAAKREAGVVIFV